MRYKKISEEVIKRKLEEKEKELKQNDKYNDEKIKYIINREANKYNIYNKFCDNRVMRYSIIDEVIYKNTCSNAVFTLVYDYQVLAKIKWINSKDGCYNIYIYVDNKKPFLLAKAYANNSEEWDFKIIANVEHEENEWEEWSPFHTRISAIYSITESLIQYCLEFRKVI